MISIIFDNSCLCWNKGMDYNLMFVIHLIDNYKKKFMVCIALMIFMMIWV